MGIVYLAEDTHLGRRVAIKFLTSSDKHYRARFLREARAVSTLSHANIATVFDYGETPEQRPYIVMELVNGKTISELLRTGGLTLAQAVEIASSIALALGEAHHHGIVHRDIKPSNVVLNDRGQVKVLDFGLVKHLFGEPSTGADPDAQTLLSARTRSDVIVGTPLYLSPEQASGKQIDGRSDLFSLGALLYECITGRSAFSGDSVLEIGAQVIHVNPPAPSSINSSVTPALDRITMKALEKKVDARYQSAEEMYKDLRNVLPAVSRDGHITLVQESRGTPASHHIPTGALATLTQTFRQKRVSLGTFIIAIVLSGLGIWALIHWWRPSPYKPGPVAADWYKKGTDALQNGAYYQASNVLSKAVEADNKFPLAHARLAEAWSELDYSDRAKDELLQVTSLVRDRSSLASIDALYLDAITATVTRDYPSAIKAYTDIAQQLPNDAPVYVDLGRAYEHNGDLDNALANYRKAISLDSNYAPAFLRSGIVYMRKPDTASANASFNDAEKLYRTLGNLEGVGEVLRQRGVLLSGMGKYEEARALFEQALTTANTNGNDSQKISALIELSRSSYNQGLTAQAKDYGQQAVNLAQQKNLENLAADGLILLGNSFMSGGDYDQAEKYFKQAIEFAHDSKGRRNEAVGLKSLGGLYIQQLRTDEGLALIQQALTFFKQSNYLRDVSDALRQIARGNRRKGDYQAALNALAENLQIAQQLGQPSVALSYAETGGVLLEQERYPEALEQYGKASDINKSLGNRVNLAFNQANRGEILWQLGRYQDADEALSEALTIANDPNSGYKQLVPEIERSYAQMALSERQFSEAKKRAEQALTLAGTQYKNVRINATYTLGLAKAFADSAREGRKLCDDAVKFATEAGDAALLPRAVLALAEAALASGDAQEASNRAKQAQAMFAKNGQQESEWRAFVVTALAQQALGDKDASQESLRRAKEIISQLKAKWDANSFDRYIARPDVQVYFKQLG